MKPLHNKTPNCSINIPSDCIMTVVRISVSSDCIMTVVRISIISYCGWEQTPQGSKRGSLRRRKIRERFLLPRYNTVYIHSFVALIISKHFSPILISCLKKAFFVLKTVQHENQRWVKKKKNALPSCSDLLYMPFNPSWY